jgi:CBS domain containing-hemolysin-like protein
LALLGVFVASVTLLSALVQRSSAIRIRHWVEESGGRLRALFDHPRRFEAFRFLLGLGAIWSPVLLGLAILLAQGSWTPAALVWAAGVPMVLGGLVEWLSRHLVHKDPEAALRRLTIPYRLALTLCTPLLPLLALAMPTATEDEDTEDEDEISEQEIEAFIDVGTREGILDVKDGVLVRSVVDFGETRVRSVMTPRIDLLCAPVSTSPQEMVRVFIDSTHSRIPIYEDSIDHIIGVLHIRDLLRGLQDPSQPTTRDLVKPVWFVPESKALDEVLLELQERRQQMAVVVDEYGGTSGLVTIEDLLEEIVGDIVDQDEELPPQMEQLSDGSWQFDGRVRIDELSRIFDLTLDTDSVDTVGGMIFSAFGYVPDQGEVIEAHGLRFTVEEVRHRRIHRVQVQEIARVEAQEVSNGG